MQKHLLTAAITTALTTGLYTANAQAADSLAGYEDDSYIVVSGTIDTLEDDSFTINHQGNIVHVDFDDWGWDWDGEDLRHYLQKGEQVVVSGEVDKNWFLEDEIEANNIYFRQKNDYYYVADMNPAYYNTFDSTQKMHDGSYMSVRGTITKMDDDELTLNSQGNMLQIDISNLQYDPSDTQKATRVNVGDRVFVYGEVDKDIFEKKEIEADAMVKLNKVNKNNRTSMNQQ